MTMCEFCKFFRVHVNPDTGRRRPTEKGDCVYPLPWPTAWPAWFGKEHRYTKPQARVWPSDGLGCETFEDEMGDGGDPEAAQGELILVDSEVQS